MKTENQLNDNAIHQATNRFLSKDIIEECSSEDDCSVPDHIFKDFLD